MKKKNGTILPIGCANCKTNGLYFDIYIFTMGS